ncbi:hypothetical protein ABZ714_19485 [Streptomyces sp. NPDC006798]|uniref:hypothetical protein n=1 Tax=Streptomyces sp. NPDC006798 TaxID=3155462 RepID=UPI0033DDE5C3
MTTPPAGSGRPLPVEPLECRQAAEQHLSDNPPAPGDHTGTAAVWALLAIAGELREIRRLLGRK